MCWQCPPVNRIKSLIRSRTMLCCFIYALPSIREWDPNLVMNRGHRSSTWSWTWRRGYITWVIGGTGDPLKPCIGLGLRSWIGDISSISHILCALTAFIKFPPIALVLIRAIAFICDLPILQTIVKGVLGSNLGVEEEAAICAIKPLETSLSEAILFLYLHALEYR
jgi:hypothetical protein